MSITSRLLLLGFLAVVTHNTAASGEWLVWQYQADPVAYRVDGQGSPVVQIHGIGAGASSEQTKYQIDALTAAGYRVYSVDLTGWGRSIGPQALFTGDYYSALIAAFLIEVVSEPAALIGHSLGGTYAIEAAASLPSQVTALVLNAPVGAESFTAEPSEDSRLRWSRFVSGEGGELAYKALGSWLSLTAFCRGSLYVDPSFCDLATVYDYRQYTRIPDSIYAAAAFLTGNLGLDVRDAFASLQQPVLLVWGSTPGFTPLSEADAFLELNKNAQLVVIDDASAMVNDEQRALFDQLTLDHLSQAVWSP